MELFTFDKNKLFIDHYEVLRYLGYKRELISETDIEMIQGRIEKARPYIKPKACFDRFKIKISANGVINMPYGEIYSKDLAANLSNCHEIFIFVATIGIDFDSFIRKSRLYSAADMVIYQAIGATAVESFCDELNLMLSNRIKEEFIQFNEIEGKVTLAPRFSPGYGDLKLENQLGIFEILNPYKNIAVTLNDSLLMTPEKSVTAIIGIRK